ncbi:hypothetical protein QBC38DRAFT_508089 [Podospora fimiseda]|uniref:Dihydroorotate dehydrogenase (fumarate) n=1 Tax=Podospora fimiseda TaxID=252190 RepID=A0AAN7BUF2_9PEZI|nr:hypothetical protein QBC38DRAFT_508089 [Podospora fimiseda]
MTSSSSTAPKTYIVEHLDEELGPWSELEYISIAKESQENGAKFFLSSLPPAFKVPETLKAIPAFTAESRGIEEMYASDKSRVCLLDPQGKSDLSPEDGEKFDVFLFGGILGDHPPRDRTSELRKKGFEGRRLGPMQMTTDTAVRVTRMVVQGKVPLDKIEYVNEPELVFNEHESTQMPFRYVKGGDGNPIMPEVCNGVCTHELVDPVTDILLGHITMAPPPIQIHPPLINSANPWATTLEDLERLYNCPSTGAVTTRTSLINAFPHDDTKHQYAFFNPSSHNPTSPNPQPSSNDPSEDQTASLNTLGYSPLPLETYLNFIKQIAPLHKSSGSKKPFIISVTGTPKQVTDSYRLISATAASLPITVHLYMEINLSCPNIPDKPPPAYSKFALLEYLTEMKTVAGTETQRIPYGLKTPPYTYATQFKELMDALIEDAGDGTSEVSFVTATNTLGGCLVLNEEREAVLPGGGVGGMAGSALHPLALGNVKQIRSLLDEPERKENLGHITVIGVGGVTDADGYRRMKGVGAGVVGVGTGLGVKGLKVFEEIEKSLEGKW